MTSTSAISRMRQYRRRHGLRATLLRAGVALSRAMSLGRMAVYACDLPVAGAPASLGTVDRIKDRSLLNVEDTNRILSHWNPDAMRRLMSERFAAGAELWLLRQDGVLAAYGWTLRGKTMEPHFLRGGADDVHLFDFFVFPEFRGRRLNPSLVWRILDQAGREGARRALIEVAAWNRAQLASLARTPFRRIGLARKFRLGKSPLIWWSHPRQS